MPAPSKDMRGPMIAIAKRVQTSEGVTVGRVMCGYPADHEIHMYTVGKCEIHELRLHFISQIIKCSRIKYDRSS
jgi:hypothetical protein